MLGRWAWQRLTDGSLGLRMRYEFSRQFSPYLGVEWAAKFGDTKSMAEDAGKQTDEISWLAGIRFWF
ncbi:copper resistance protein B [Photobacterium sp.]|uniref:copper resistance protein B n=1 Tax=Photobacterium sp. TaxID=660 RepID=UPI00299EF75C|nr:copper resistance protein B [Photobacterium sp.]MDX1301524.1 copper resistance protein B [Photobacterium sp.]